MKKYVNTKEIQDMLGVSSTTLWRMRNEGMPYVRINQRQIRYVLEEVQKWIEEKADTRPKSIIFDCVDSLNYLLKEGTGSVYTAKDKYSVEYLDEDKGFMVYDLTEEEHISIWDTEDRTKWKNVYFYSHEETDQLIIDLYLSDVKKRSIKEVREK